MQFVNFGVIDRYILIGGNQLFFDAAKYLTAKNKPINVVTSGRHAQANIETGSAVDTLEHALQSIGVEFHISKDIETDQELQNDRAVCRVI